MQPMCNGSKKSNVHILRIETLHEQIMMKMYIMHNKCTIISLRIKILYTILLTYTFIWALWQIWVRVWFLYLKNKANLTTRHVNIALLLYLFCQCQGTSIMNACEFWNHWFIRDFFGSWIRIYVNLGTCILKIKIYDCISNCKNITTIDDTTPVAMDSFNSQFVTQRGTN